MRRQAVGVGAAAPTGEALLAALDAIGEAEIARRRAEAEARVQQILGEAERAAAARRAAARREAMSPAAGENARLLQQARLEAARLVGEARLRFVEMALAQARRRLAGVRAHPQYPSLLRQWVEEAIQALGPDEIAGASPRWEADPRDAALLQTILRGLGCDSPVTASLKCAGGVVARSGDGQVTVINTLEARLERALPILRRDLAALMDRSLSGLQELKELAPVP